MIQESELIFFWGKKLDFMWKSGWKTRLIKHLNVPGFECNGGGNHMEKENIRADNLNKLDSVLSNYILHDKLHQAVMISAPWGAGKTWYLRKTFIPSFQTKHKKSWGFIYVSMFGVKSLNELDDVIYHQFINFYVSKYTAKKIPSKAMRIGDIALNLANPVFNKALGISVKEELDKALRLIPQPDHIVYVLDDIERTSIDISELFGYVNNLCEHENSRVILIANEDEIRKKYPLKFDDGDSATDKTKRKKENDGLRQEESIYNVAKEKVVSLTIRFHVTQNEVFDSILDNIIDKKDEYLKERIIAERNFIYESLLPQEDHENSREMNLRILAFIFATISDLYKFVKESLIHIKESKDSSDCNPNIINDSEDEIIQEFIRYTARQCLKFKRSKSLDTSSVSLWDKSGKYFYMRYVFPFVQAYIKERWFSEKEAFQYLKAIFNEEITRERMDASDVSMLYQWRTSNDDEITRTIKKIEAEPIPAGMGPDYIRNMMFIFLILQNEGFAVDMEMDIAKIVQFIENLPEIFFNKEALSIEDITSDSNIIQKYNEVMNPVYTCIAKRLAALSRKEFEFLLETKWDADFRITCKNHWGSFMSEKKFLSIADTEKMVHKLDVATPAEVFNFYEGVRAVYNIVNVRDFYKADYKTVAALCNEIRRLICKYGQQSSNIVKISNLKMLQRLLDNTRESLKPDEKKNNVME